MIAIIDYGAGNLKSVFKAFEYLGHDVAVTADSAVIDMADRVVLPGVGQFGDAMGGLLKAGLIESVYKAVETGKPFLGICIGMQLLFEGSEESPATKGLGIVKGQVEKLPQAGLKIPQMGWNSLEFTKPCPIFDGLKPDELVYFVHSYCPKSADRAWVAATTWYGATLDVAVAQGSCFATQFHPEKSGAAGLKILDNFARLSL